VKYINTYIYWIK